MMMTDDLTTHQSPRVQTFTRVKVILNCLLMRWLQLRFDFDSTAVRSAFDWLSKVIKVTVT